MRRLALVLALGACAAEPSAFEAAVPDVPGLRLELVYAVSAGEGVRVGGLDGALDPGAALELDGLAVIADARGRFVLELGHAASSVELGFGGERYAIRVRDPAAARAAAVLEPLAGGAGDTPNDLAFLDAERAVLVRSGDDALSVLDPLVGLEGARGVRLPSGARAANPWFAARIDADTVAVTAFARHLVYVIDLRSGAVLAELAAPRVTLEAPFRLASPLDLDGDGAPERELAAFAPRSPQGVVVGGGRLLAAFSGFAAARRSAELAPVFVPGVVLSWPLDALDAAPAVRVTSALDPQELALDGEGRVLVTLSGAVDQAPDGRVFTSSGAVELLDPVTLAPLRRWSLGDFGPTTARVAGGALWVGSLARGRVRALALAGDATLAELSLSEEAVDSIFRWVELPGGLLGAASFNTDRLHVIDPVERSLDPLPFGGPLALGPGRPLFDGLQIVARRPGRAGVDFVGPDLLAMSKSSKLVPVELRKVLGP